MQDTNLRRGVATIAYASDALAYEAIRLVNDRHFGERPIVVMLSNTAIALRAELANRVRGQTAGVIGYRIAPTGISTEAGRTESAKLIKRQLKPVGVRLICVHAHVP